MTHEPSPSTPPRRRRPRRPGRPGPSTPLDRAGRRARGPGAAGRSSRRAGVAMVAGALVAVLAGTALFVSGWSLGRQAALTPGTPVDDAEAFQPFWDTYRAVTERYAGDEVDRKALVEGAIKGMITALGDPYSMYLTSEEYKASLQGLSGEFEGIGATIGTVDAAGKTSSCTELAATDCRMAIVAPIKDSPAEKAGLRPGDIVVAIDGDDARRARRSTRRAAWCAGRRARRSC